ncbi:DUF4384 domain-containing protein [bacterium]|nr:DUF4384 domain-containing protein [bacterium]
MKKAFLIVPLILGILLVGIQGVFGEPDNAGRKIERIIHDPVPPDYNSGIDVWLNKSGGSSYRTGEEIRVYFRSEYSGYVVIYDIEPDGNCSILFPYYSNDNNYVHAGRTYKIPGRRDNYTLRVSGPAGLETIIAVLSPCPIYDYQGYGRKIAKLTDSGRTEEGIKRIIHDPGCNRAIDQEHFWVMNNYHSPNPPYCPNYLGSVYISSYPAGAMVSVDGYYYGITPLTVFLPCGSHGIALKHQYFPEYRQKIRINSGGNKTIYANLSEN